MLVSMLKQCRYDPVDQSAQKAGRLQPRNLFMFEGMLDVGLDAGKMTAKRPYGGIARNTTALLGKAGQGVR